MTVQEILDEIAERYPHGLSDASVIRKLNQVQADLFRTLYRVQQVGVYGIQAGVFVYSLPFPRSNLESVIVDGAEYGHQDAAKDPHTPYFYFIGDALAISPTPKVDLPAGLTLFYYQSPTTLSASSLSAVPELDADYHMLLVYGGLVSICEVFQDVAMVNNYTEKYNGVLDSFQEALIKEPRNVRIDDVMGGAWLV